MVICSAALFFKGRIHISNISCIALSEAKDEISFVLFIGKLSHDMRVGHALFVTALPSLVHIINT